MPAICFSPYINEFHSFWLEKKRLPFLYSIDFCWGPLTTCLGVCDFIELLVDFVPGNSLFLRLMINFGNGLIKKKKKKFGNGRKVPIYLHTYTIFCILFLYPKPAKQCLRNQSFKINSVAPNFLLRELLERVCISVLPL